jgi:two-component system response regulator FlrC
MSATTARSPRLMIVDDDPGVGYAVTRWMQDHNIKSVLAGSTQEALDMLRDIAFIDASFDGLLVDYNLPDATGFRVIQEVLDEFPSVPIALMTGGANVAMEVWVRSRGIPLFRKPLDMDAVQVWIDGFKKQAS